MNGLSESPTPAQDYKHPRQSISSSDELQGPSGAPKIAVPDNPGLSAPSSPYAIQRATVRSLTLPTTPNLDIPTSPPGSPPPGADQKFAHFLELKKQGTHFNAKLASSSALKNPSLFPKLLGFAGVESEKQYATALPSEMWDPAWYPTWAYKEELAKAQHEISKRKEEERAKAPRESIEFSLASNSEQSSRGGTPGIGGGVKGLRGSVAERVMAGLDRERKPSPHVGATFKNESMRADIRSRSPKRRKRSLSR